MFGYALVFQSSVSGNIFCDFDTIHFEPNERPEDLFQRLTSFVVDNLLQMDRRTDHHSESDEKNSPALYYINSATFTKQEFSSSYEIKIRTRPTRTKTLANLKPEISQVLESLLE